MNIPSDRKYSEEHEWALLEGNIATVGITAHATESLGDVVFVELPEAGSQIEQFAKFGEIESVKAVSDLLAPVGGEIVEVNGQLTDSPGTVNQDPYGAGWLLKVKVADSSQINNLMDDDAYGKLIA